MPNRDKRKQAKVNNYRQVYLPEKGAIRAVILQGSNGEI